MRRANKSGLGRLAPRESEVIDRTKPLTFTWNGRRYRAYEGDTITSALTAAGERIFSRSFKYHRPRGLLTADYLDPGCTVQVGDEPNVRASHRLVEQGMQVTAQNTWPSPRFDVKAANQLIGRFLSTGFYYKTFMRPQALWPLYDRVLRQFSSGGVVSSHEEGLEYDKRYAHPDVLIAGGGPAGMAAALAAAQDGAEVMLVEEEHQLGGHLRWEGPQQSTLARLRTEVLSHSAIEVLTNSAVLGRYDDNWVAIVQRSHPHVRERLIKARAKTLVVSPGLVERPYVFRGNDLPGVMLSTAVRKLVNLYSVKPGEQAVVLTANESGDAAAEDLRAAGVSVAEVVDLRSGVRPLRARGKHGVQAVEYGGRVIDCDLLVTATGWTAPTSLLNMAGDKPIYDPRSARFLPDPDSLPDTVLAAGGIAGDGSVEKLIEHADAAGRAAARRAASLARARSANLPSRRGIAETAPSRDGARSAAVPELTAHEHPELFHSGGEGFVDLTEDVTYKDLAQAISEGYDSAELAKRYTTATMGPTQGKLEVVNTVAIIAELTGTSLNATGTTTWRPPYAPVTLGALAGRIFEPVRYSPMHSWHTEHGAAPSVAGAWIRPDHYGDPAGEVRTVRNNVGIIDVTPIGKLDLRGPDVPKLLNLLYTNKWSKLDVGRVRYGAMCGDDGIVLDDGVTGRLGPQHYLMSTTSSGAAMVWEWLEHWLQTEHPEWQVHVTPVTTAYASINVAGPKSRELIGRLTEGVDLAAAEFPYMRVRTGRVAGVDECVLWRIGFTGELSYELHVPAAYGLHVWEALMREGQDLGVRPFGVEAQRILRLEKGHLIVGQDTDGLTQGCSAGLDGAIKLDKEDFVGKPELEWQLSRADGPRLVALRTLDESIVPEESSQIIDGSGKILGRITSSRMSPTLERSICLAQVQAEHATPSTTVTIKLRDGRKVHAQVADQLCHVDPSGERMRV